MLSMVLEVKDSWFCVPARVADPSGDFPDPDPDPILKIQDLTVKETRKGLTQDNWVSGARVRMSHVRFSLGGGKETVTLGNPAVHRLGDLNPDLTFSCFSSSGLPLSVATLHPCMYLYNCSH